MSLGKTLSIEDFRNSIRDETPIETPVKSLSIEDFRSQQKQQKRDDFSIIPQRQEGQSGFQNIKTGVEQASLGFQEGAQLTAQLFGADRGREIESLQGQQPPQTEQEEVFRTLGAFFPVGPGGVNVAGSARLVNGLGMVIAKRAGASGQSAKKVLQSIGGKLAALKGGGFNQKVPELLEQKPQLVFSPKKDWQSIHTGVFDFIKKEKKRIGQELGSMKQQVKEVLKDVKIDPSELIDEVDSIAQKEQIIKGSTAAKSKNQIINLIRSGGKTLGDGGKRLATDTRVFSAEKARFIRKTINIDQLETVLNGIDETSVMKELANNSANTGVFKPTQTQRKILEIRDVIKSRFDDLISEVDDIAARDGLIKAKGDYAKLAQRNRLIGGKGGISQNQVPQKLTESLTIGKENQFDAWREMLPEAQFDEAIGSLLNQSSKKFEATLKGLSTQFGQQRAGAGLIASNISKVGGLLGGKRPQFPIGETSTKLINARRRFEQGLRSADKNTRIIARGKLIKGLTQGTLAEIERSGLE